MDGRARMEGESDTSAPVHSKQYAALRSDLSAALAAFDRAQDWAVGAAARSLFLRVRPRAGIAAMLHCVI